GGGYIGLEKLEAVVNNSPATAITLVAITVSNEIKAIAAKYPSIKIVEKPYHISDLDNKDLVIAAVNDIELASVITADAQTKGILINAADKPDLCDFYLGSIVKKGDLKIAISTNGKSPTVAKRLKETFNELIPNEMEDVLNNMSLIRNKLKGDFNNKITQLNNITKVMVNSADLEQKEVEKRWKKVASWFLFAFFFMFFGHLVLSYVPFNDLMATGKSLASKIDNKFYWMIAAGFFAQLVDGALGMGYGVTCTTILLSLGVNLAAISGSIHTAEMFSSGASGYTHYKFGNVNKKLFKALLIPGIIGAIVGAYLLFKFGDEYAQYVRPILALYTLLLGVRILIVAFRKKQKNTKVKRVGWLAGIGGFLDSFGGGGWGPLVTSTLIAKGRTPKYVIGSVSLSEFFVTLASAITFFSLLGISHWHVIVGLILGGLVAAPLAAKLSGKLPLKTMFIGVGTMVIIWSLRILVKAISGLI
ncbi:MAG: TSUP family transporter, partial [Chitinophagaceae bacterium]